MSPDVKTFDEIADVTAEGWARVPWDQVRAEGEEKRLFGFGRGVALV